MNQYKTQSEENFAEYLGKLSRFYDYEKDWGGKTPDFTIYSDKNKKTIVAIADNKDSDYSKHEKRVLRETGRLIRNSNPYTQLRKKIHGVREQFKYAKQYPCILIIYSVGPIMATPLIVFGAMLGDIGISIPIRVGGGLDSPRKTESFFGKRGKMIDEKHGQPQNQTITAVGLLGYLQPEAEISGFNQELKRRLEAVSIKQKNWLETATQITNELTTEVKNRGYNNLEMSATYVDFVVNPFARIPFPRKYFERGYTYIHEYDLNTGEIKLTFDWTKATKAVSSKK